MVDWMLTQGHDVLTAHLARPEVMGEEVAVEPETVYARDIAWLEEAEALVADVTTPSHGVGYEIAYAILGGKRVLCVAREDVKVSKMITGNPRLRFARYTDAEQAIQVVARFLGRVTDDRFA